MAQSCWPVPTHHPRLPSAGSQNPLCFGFWSVEWAEAKHPPQRLLGALLGSSPCPPIGHCQVHSGLDVCRSPSHHLSRLDTGPHRAEHSDWLRGTDRRKSQLTQRWGCPSSTAQGGCQEPALTGPIPTALSAGLRRGSHRESAAPVSLQPSLGLTHPRPQPGQ